MNKFYFASTTLALLALGAASARAESSLSLPKNTGTTTLPAELELRSQRNGQERYELLVSPAVFVDYANGRLILSDELSHGGAFQKANENGRYTVRIRKGLAGGLGPNFSVKGTDGAVDGFKVYASLVPLIGKDAESVRIVDSLSEAEKVAPLSLPKSPADLLTWRPGESLRFRSRGGLIFTAGVGYSALSVGGKYVAMGSWSTELHRQSDNMVFAKITREKIESLSLVASATVAKVEAGLFGQEDNHFTFTMDLNQPGGQDVLNAVLRGDLNAAKSLVGKDNFEPRLSVESSLRGSFARLSVGVPGINLSHTTQHGGGEGLVFTHKDEQETRVHVAYYASQRDSEFFLSENRSSGWSVISQHAINTASPQPQLDLQIGYAYVNNSTNTSELNKAIAEVARVTGAFKISLLRGPSRTSRGDTDVRHAKVALAINLETDAVLALLQYGQTAELENVLSADARSRGLEYFQASLQEVLAESKDDPAPRLRDPLQLCEKGYAKQLCRTRVITRAEKAAKLAAQALQDAVRAHREANAAELSKALARLGEQMLKSPFVFQSLTSQLPPNVEGSLTIASTEYKLQGLWLGHNDF